VGYVSYQEQWLDSTGPFKDVMISMFATLAKQERARISERTIAGLKVARTKRQEAREAASSGRDRPDHSFAKPGFRDRSAKDCEKHRISARHSQRNFVKIAARNLLAETD
jgi:DNA invertase Pin-like site-specific DNA recombinase